MCYYNIYFIGKNNNLLILGSGIERTFRYIGLIELSKLQLVDIFYFYLPEMIMVCASTIIQRVLIKINSEEEETSDTFMEIPDTDPAESRGTWQQTSSISIAISIGKICKMLIYFIYIYIFF